MPLSQPKRGIKDKFKELFTSKSKSTSRTHSPALPAENIYSTKVCTDCIFEVSPITNPTGPIKEIPSDQINAPELAAVDAAREDASRAASDMRVIAAPVQSAASAIGDADNPIPLVDFISSFLKTLSSFNSIVDKIATVRSAVPTRPVRSSHA
jgi:hypothetical protein